MATKIRGEIKRQIRLYCVDAPVNLTIHEGGIAMAVAGMRQKVFASWEDIARGLRTSGDVPSYLAGKPLEFLKHQAAKRKKAQQE